MHGQDIVTPTVSQLTRTRSSAFLFILLPSSYTLLLLPFRKKESQMDYRSVVSFLPLHRDSWGSPKPNTIPHQNHHSLHDRLSAVVYWCTHRFILFVVANAFNLNCNSIAIPDRAIRLERRHRSYSKIHAIHENWRISSLPLPGIIKVIHFSMNCSSGPHNEEEVEDHCIGNHLYPKPLGKPSICVHCSQTTLWGGWGVHNKKWKRKFTSNDSNLWLLHAIGKQFGNEESSGYIEEIGINFPVMSSTNLTWPI